MFVDLSDKHIVVAGAGKIAARRIKVLSDFVDKITVIAPVIHEDILEMASAAPAQLEIRQRAFEPNDLQGADLVLAATNDHELNQAIALSCKEKGIPVNASHRKELCDFYFPGVIHADHVVVGVTASGKDHAQAKEVTDQIRKIIES